MFVWSATPPCQGGSQPISPYTMHSSSPYIREDTEMNGAAARNVIATLPTIHSFPVSTAMNITARPWMTNIRVKTVTNITAWHVWIATQQGVQIKV